MSNGNKPSWLTYLTALGIILILLLNFTKLSDRIGNKNVVPALLAEKVKTIEARVSTVEFDFQENAKVDGKQTTDIAVLQSKFDEIDKKLEKILEKL